MKKIIIRFVLTSALFTPHLNAAENSILDIKNAIVAWGNIQSNLRKSLEDLRERANTLNATINAPSKEGLSQILLNFEDEEELRKIFREISDLKRDLFEVSRNLKGLTYKLSTLQQTALPPRKTQQITPEEVLPSSAVEKDDDSDYGINGATSLSEGRSASTSPPAGSPVHSTLTPKPCFTVTYTFPSTTKP